jgi:inosine/xanthosine triphosphatase
MLRIIVASTNPVKIKAAQGGFLRMFPEQIFEINGINVESGVSDQPFGNLETLQGAKKRAENARNAAPDGDFWVGIEGGVEDDNGELAAFAWIVVLSSNLCGKGRTGTFFLPKAVAELVRQGKELGEADDIVFGKQNSKQQNGALGLLTGDILNRTILYEFAVMLALIPFKNPGLYQEEKA